MINLLSITVVIAQVASGQAPARAYSVTTKLPYSIEAELNRLAAAKLPVQRTKHTAPLTREAAIASVRTSLGKLAKPGNDKAIDAIGNKASPRGMRALAADLMLAERPAAAIAVLLEANKQQPNDPYTTLSLANVLVSTGFGAEAIALTDTAAASPTLKAMALTTRGHALITIGKSSEAESLLRRAMGLDPTIAEAAECLAYILIQKGQRAEAGRVIEESGRGDLKRPGTKRRPLEKAFDLSGGTNVPFPNVLRVSGTEVSLEPNEKLKEFTKRLEAWRNGLDPERQPLENDVERRRNSGELNALTSRIASEIQNRLEYELNYTAYGANSRSQFPSDARGVKLAAEVREAENEVSVAAERALEEFSKKMEQAAMEMARAQSCEPMAKLYQQQSTQQVPAVDKLEDALKEWWTFVSPRATGLVGNLKDPMLYELAKLEVENTIILVEAALWSARAPTYVGPGYAAQCAKLMADRAAAEEAEAFEKRVSTLPCNLNSHKIKISVAFIEAKANCEEVSIKLMFSKDKLKSIFGGGDDAGPIDFDAGFFAEGTLEAKGQWTIYAGYEATAAVGPIAEANAQFGGFITGNSEGISDFGVRAVGEASNTFGGVESSGDLQAEFTASDFKSLSAEFIIITGLD